MERREAFKKMGLMGLIGISGMALVSCASKEEKIEKVSSIKASTIPKVKSERELLITNRELKTIADPANPTKAELKHTPEIIIGEKNERGNTLVKITVGKDGIIHPATENHWIDFIKVYVNDRLVVESEFANGGIRGYGHYYIELNKGDVVIVEAACNIHGIWENSIEV
ncbi:MAG: twin-arginine translocation pathway signal protein [Bacteroidetes bacterium]|nr:MAG: twin-arginine translocation pathway signal protein [Bacteroidota bacterium]